jgi:hypothetical protein
MNRKQFLTGMFTMMMCVTMSFALNNDKQCTALTKKNVQCKNTTKDEGGKCYLHNPNYVKKKVDNTLSTQCNGTSESTNKQCKRKTKHSSGFCHNHRD